MLKRILYIGILAILPQLIAAQSTESSILSLIPQSDEVFRWGYSELDAQGRQLYDSTLATLVRFEANNFSPYYYHRVDLPCIPNTVSIQEVTYLLTRLQHDVPELFILGSTVPRYDYQTYIYYARIGYVNSPESYLSQLQALRLAADSILMEITPEMSDYEKLLVLHDGFIRWGDYGDMTGADAGNIRGALLNKRAVCEGFAYAGLYLCQRIGIPCIFVEVQQITSTVNNTWGNHAINYVKLDGQWYMMDLTADGGFPNIVGHAGFLRGQTHFDESYRLENEDGLLKNAAAYNALPALAQDDYDPNAEHNTDPGDQNPDDEEHASLEETALPSRTGKVIINGHLYIRSGEGIYSATGQRIR